MAAGDEVTVRKEDGALVVVAQEYPSKRRFYQTTAAGNSSRVILHLATLTGFNTGNYTQANMTLLGGGDYDNAEWGLGEWKIRVWKRGTSNGVFLDVAQAIAPRSSDNGTVKDFAGVYNPSTGEVRIYMRTDQNGKYMHYDFFADYGRGCNMTIIHQLDQSFATNAIPSGFQLCDNVPSTWLTAR